MRAAQAPKYLFPIFVEQLKLPLRLCEFISRACKRLCDLLYSFCLADRICTFFKLAVVLDMLTRELHLGHPKRRRGPLEEVA